MLFGLPNELVLLGAVMLFGAWLVLDQRSLKDKFAFIILIIFLYVAFQWLSGKSMVEIISPVTQYFYHEPPPPEE